MWMPIYDLSKCCVACFRRLVWIDRAGIVQWWLGVALVCLGLGCSSSAPETPADAGPPPETSCPSENGAAACSRYLDAWCRRFVRCCTAPGSCLLACQHLTKEATDYNACDQASCKAYAARIGFDCSAPRYSSKEVCKVSTDECLADLPLMACSDMTAGTSSPPPSCIAWGKQF